VIYDAIALGIPLSRIHDITKIDMWFLKQYEELYTLEKRSLLIKWRLCQKNCCWKRNKRFADRQIAHMMRCLESQVHTLRMTMNINRVFKLVDTCAAEFKAKHLITTRHLKPK
jgi:carbamoyl-phosphate synthase large subunit